MPAGKSNRGLWKEQIDKLPVQAGSSFDKEAVWEKLHRRMHGKKERQRRIFRFRWIAASVMVFLAIFFLLPGRNKQAVKVEIISGTEDVNRVPAEKQEPAELSVEKARAIPSINKNNVQPVTTVHKNSKKEEYKEKIQLSDFREEESATVQPAPDTVAATTVILAASPATTKKKLKVVHNNELGDQGMPIIEKNWIATNQKGFFPGFRRPVTDNEEYFDDTISRKKPKRSMLPFSSLISQKE